MNNSLHKVEERLTYLYSLKSRLVPKVKEWQDKYHWTYKDNVDPYQSAYRTNTIFSIINAKKAEILAWTQEYDFIPMDDDALKNNKLIKYIWDYEWLNSRTDKFIEQAVHSALMNGDWYLYEWTRKIIRNIKVPTENTDGTISFFEQEIVDYDGIYSEYIPWENIFHDWTDISDANEVVWIKHWDRQSFINTFWLNKNYKNVNESLPIGKYYYIWENGNIDVKGNMESDSVVSEIRYYNKSKDEMIILANGVEIYSSPIPYKHKELPFCQFSDYKIDGRPYSMGEYELLEWDEKFKDALRSLYIDILKAQMWFTVISPDADFDEATVEIGVRSFARVDPKDISHFTPSIWTNNILQAEEKADNDIIIKSGIDFRSQALGQQETATKVQAKAQSARKRINLMLKINGFNFFERLARLRMANLQLIYWNTRKKVSIKGGNIDGNGNFEPLSSGFWLYTTQPEHMKGKFNVIPITDSILWTATARDKASLLEFSQIVGNMMWEDGKPIINTQRLVEEISRRYGIDYEKLTAKNTLNKSAEDILKEVDMEDNWTPVGSELDPNYIPPAQRSWAKSAVPVLGSIAANNDM